MAEKRKYTGKDVEMLLSALTITDNAIANKDFLIPNRSTWADPYFDEFRLKINTTIENRLGVDNAKNLRLSTQALVALQTDALQQLSTFDIQLKVDFGSDPSRLDEIRRQLGITQHFKAAKGGDQEALIELLYKYKDNMTIDLKAEITTAGISATLIDHITAAADATRDANITQEGHKGTRKEITADAVTEFNNVYEQLIGICKIARNLYLGQDDKRELFSYAKVLGSLNYSNNSPDDGTED